MRTKVSMWIPTSFSFLSLESYGSYAIGEIFLALFYDFLPFLLIGFPFSYWNEQSLVYVHSPFLHSCNFIDFSHGCELAWEPFEELKRFSHENKMLCSDGFVVHCFWIGRGKRRENVLFQCLFIVISLVIPSWDLPFSRFISSTWVYSFLQYSGHSLIFHLSFMFIHCYLGGISWMVCMDIRLPLLPLIRLPLLFIRFSSRSFPL